MPQSEIQGKKFKTHPPISREKGEALQLELFCLQLSFLLTIRAGAY